MTTQKRAFSGKPQGDADTRQAVATEFIAHYLDRIDDHLAIIGKQAELNVKLLEKIEKNLLKK